MLAVELQIGAILHFDPLCRSRLRNWLKNLYTEKCQLPGFIAIEWDREIFEQVKQQRSCSSTAWRKKSGPVHLRTS